MKLSILTFSNGIKTVKYVGMIHISPKSYYEKVKDAVYSHPQGVHFYEGIEKTDEELTLPFWVALVSQKGVFRTFIKDCTGWVLQDQEAINEYHSNNVRADMTDKEFFTKVTSIDDDMTEEKTKDMIEAFKKLRGKTKTRMFIGFILRGLLSWITFKTHYFGEKKNNDKNVARKKAMKVIIDERSEILADAILATPEKEIITTYGLGHWESVLRILNEKDNAHWKVIKKERV